uniref:Zinc finger GRF-type domain-containing protein n=1 Tax=Setaria viridis TaxID=4556 RepID=A0A4U6W600_SETVI|nr:hypothetical protein SEVIR_1G019100v2 [Setaria viridis]
MDGENGKLINEVVPPPMVDEVTGLPLIMCSNCKHLRLTAFTCKWTKNRGKRFFKCPKNDDWVSGSFKFVFISLDFAQCELDRFLQVVIDVALSWFRISMSSTLRVRVICS